LIASGCTCDVMIVGGGLVGASLACALGGQGLRIAVIEAVPYTDRARGGYDDRAIALAQGSRRIFDALQMWDFLEPVATPIGQIHVSDRGHFGFTRLDCRDEGVAALGYVVTSRELGRVLGERLRSLPDIDLFCPARVDTIRSCDDVITLEVRHADTARTLSGRLVVAADGARSSVREQFDIPVTRREYGQTAVIANIATQLDHRNIAYERFTESGPLALLPMGERRCALVWTIDDANVAQVMALDEQQFLARLQERFGYRLGRLERCGARQAYPLRLVRARECVRHRLALIGNAAHTLHPVAGQGFNLGLRDMVALAEVVVDAARQGLDVGERAVLNRYEDWRRADQRRVVSFTDGVARLFSLPLAPLGFARDAGMVFLDLLPPAKRLFSRLTMGRAGRLPRLARGLPL
jgi:2-octaprenyl-6-methoxyphenol hydroxylase